MADQNQVDLVSDYKEKLLKNPKRNNNKYASAISILACITSILLGYDSGVMSGATLYIKEDLKISDEQIEILVGTISVYSLIGAAVAGRTSDWIGRRSTIIFASAIFLAGAILMGFATNYTFLMVGRFVAGIGMGYALMIAPVYAAEVAPPSSRGFLTSFPEVFGNVGLLLGYISNYAFSNLPTNLGWRVMLGLAVFPSLLLAIGVLAMPESPRWLVMQGRLDDARAVLDKTSDSPEESQLRLTEIIDATTKGKNIILPHGEGAWRELFLNPTRPIKHILLAGLGIHFFQQASGTDAIVLYSPRIFEKAGLRKDSQKLLATVAVGFSKTVFTLVATFLVDRVGRRVLLLASCGGVTVSLAGLAIGLAAIDGNEDGGRMTWAVGLCVAMSLSCMAFFSIGMGPIAWVYSSEIFPLRLRAQGCGVGVAVNRLTSGVVSMTFISLYQAITISGAFFMYTGVAVVSWVFFYTILPETQGRTLEEVEGLFGTFHK